MNKKVEITGALDYQKLNELSKEQKDDFVKKDIERIMNNHVEAHEKDEEPHYYNKDDSYSITADYSIVGKFYKKEGHITATATYKYGTGAKIRKVEYQSA